MKIRGMRTQVRKTLHRGVGSLIMLALCPFFYLLSAWENWIDNLEPVNEF